MTKEKERSGTGTLALLERKVRARTQDLQNANIAAQNVLEDLSIEKSKVEIARAKEEAILLSIGDGLLATDERGSIIHINETAETLLGKKRKEVLGKAFSEVIAIEDEKGVSVPLERNPVQMALTAGVTTTTTMESSAYYYVRQDKTRFPAAITVTPVILEGKVIGTIEVFRDVTKEKEIDRSKTEFVSLASHQLRTPLSSVRWYSEMLLEGDAGVITGKQRQYLEEIHRGNLRMIELVNTLLTISQHELGTAQIHAESVQLREIVTEVLQDLESRSKKRPVCVKIDIHASLPSLTTDAKLLRIVVENLISNALKYTRLQGTVRIAAQEIRVGGLFHTQKAAGQSVGFSVSDNGIGIPLAEQSQIFQKLFRAENARIVDIEGTGLGLYLTRLVVRRMKGQIWFTSQNGHGTTFYVLFPCANPGQQEGAMLAV